VYLFAFSFTAHAANLAVGYQTGIDPSKVLKADGERANL